MGAPTKVRLRLVEVVLRMRSDPEERRDEQRER